MRRHKYGNVKTQVDGITFDSRKESVRWGELLFLQKAGQIRELARQVRYPITVNGVEVCTYIADFTYTDCRSGQVVIEDVKSAYTRKLPLYRIKAKLMLACHGVTISEV